MIFVNSDPIIHCCFWTCHLTLFEAKHKLRLLQPQYLVFGKKEVTSNIQRQKLPHPSCCQLGWSRVFAGLKKTIKRRNVSAPHFHLFASLRDCTTFQPRSLFSNVKVGNTTSDRKTFPRSALGWESLAQILFQRGDGLTRDMTSDDQTLRMIFAGSFDFQFPAEYPFALTARSIAIRATVGSIDVFVQSSWWSQR